MVTSDKTLLELGLIFTVNLFLQGGYVDLCRGVWRIQGSLAVSRGIGDRQLKQYVIPEPETKVLRIKPEHEFIIMASDGLWDKVY